jgi:hypothetical protein
LKADWFAGGGLRRHFIPDGTGFKEAAKATRSAGHWLHLWLNAFIGPDSVELSFSKEADHPEGKKNL